MLKIYLLIGLVWYVVTILGDRIAFDDITDGNCKTSIDERFANWYTNGSFAKAILAAIIRIVLWPLAMMVGVILLAVCLYKNMKSS